MMYQSSCSQVVGGEEIPLIVIKTYPLVNQHTSSHGKINQFDGIYPGKMVIWCDLP